jgi:hypothetical protein
MQSHADMREHALPWRTFGANDRDRRTPPTHKGPVAVVVAVALVSLLGTACGLPAKVVAIPSSDRTVWMAATTWQGTALVAPSGEVTASATQRVRIADCRVVPKPPPRPWASVDETPPPHTYSVLALDRDCVIPVERASLSPTEGDPLCALSVGGERRVIRVTDVAIRHPVSGLTRYGARQNWRDLDIHLGGDDVASGQHVAFVFSGRPVDDLAPPAICSPEHDPFAVSQGSAQSP